MAVQHWNTGDPNMLSKAAHPYVVPSFLHTSLRLTLVMRPSSITLQSSQLLLDSLLQKVPGFQYLYAERWTAVTSQTKGCNTFETPAVTGLTCFWVISGSHRELRTTLACSTCLLLDHWLCSLCWASSVVTPSRSVILETAWEEKTKVEFLHLVTWRPLVVETTPILILTNI